MYSAYIFVQLVDKKVYWRGSSTTEMGRFTDITWYYYRSIHVHVWTGSAETAWVQNRQEDL